MKNRLQRYTNDRFFNGILTMKKFGYLTRSQFASFLGLDYESVYPYIKYVVQGRYCIYNQETEIIKLCPLEDHPVDYELLNCIDVVCELNKVNNLKEVHVLDFEDPPFELFIVTGDDETEKFFNIVFFRDGKEELDNYKIQKTTKDEDFIVYLEKYNEEFIKENHNPNIKIFAWKNRLGNMEFKANESK